MEEIIQTCGGVLFNEHRQVLLVEHKADAEHKLGLYGFPAGKAVKGETDVCTAIREIEEETGVVLKEVDVTELPILYESIIETKQGSQHFTMRLLS
jgi:8-oxo-dGTP pyrophosphatase MutT (NUDIX family)